MERFFNPIFANGVHDVRSRFWMWIFSTNFNNFAAECDSISKISHNERSLGFF